MQTQNIHTNPINNKIRKNRHRNQTMGEFLNLKQNHQQNSQKNKVLQQISMNMRQKNAPVQTINKLFNNDGNHILNRSYSISQAGQDKQTQKYINHIRRQNQHIRQKIKEADQKLENIQAKKNKLQQKYNKLKQNQSSKLKAQVKKLHLNINSSHQQNSDIQWNSLLQASATNPHKSIESRTKLSDIRQKNSQLDFSSIRKFVKQSRKQIGHSLTKNLKFQ